MSPSGSGRGRSPGRHLVLVGATASGKSAVALALAARRIAAGHPVEIVSADSMQVYRGMDIGTAKPSPEDRAKVPHHLIDLVEPDAEYSVAEFARSAGRAIDDIESRGGSALLVGGTGLYVQSVVDELQLPGRYPEVAARLAAEDDTAALHRRLRELDPLAASRIEASNRRRILRALEVTIGAGRPFSDFGPGLGEYPPTPFVLCGLRLEREEVRRRIDERYREQMDAGFLDEVRRLRERGSPLSRTAAQALGYKELLAHLGGDMTLDEALDLASTRTRQFAVRQIRWFRRDPRIVWFDHGPDADATARRIDALWSKRVADRLASTATVAVDHAPVDT